MAHGSDMMGRPCTREEVAAGLGFVNVAALDRWQKYGEKFQESGPMLMQADLANVVEELKMLRAAVAAVEARLSASGVEIICCDQLLD